LIIMEEPDKAKLVFEKMLLIYEMLSLDVATDREVANARYWIGRCWLGMRKLDNAKALLETVLMTEERLSLTLKIDLDISDTHYWISRCLIEIQKPDEAKELLEKALLNYEKSSQDITTDRRVANTCYWIGRCFLHMNNLNDAETMLQRALLIEENLSSDVAIEVSIMCYWIGCCFVKMKNQDQAKSYFNKYFEIKRKISINDANKHDKFCSHETNWNFVEKLKGNLKESDRTNNCSDISEEIKIELIGQNTLAVENDLCIQEITYECSRKMQITEPDETKNLKLETKLQSVNAITENGNFTTPETNFDCDEKLKPDEPKICFDKYLYVKKRESINFVTEHNNLCTQETNRTSLQEVKKNPNCDVDINFSVPLVEQIVPTSFDVTNELHDSGSAALEEQHDVTTKHDSRSRSILKLRVTCCLIS